MPTNMQYWMLNLLISLSFVNVIFFIVLQKVRQEYMDVESEYLERKNSYDKVAVGLEMDKQALEKECDTFQVNHLPVQ